MSVLTYLVKPVYSHFVTCALIVGEISAFTFASMYICSVYDTSMSGDLG